MRWGGGVPNRVPEVKKDSARNGTGEENSRKFWKSVPRQADEVVTVPSKRVFFIEIFILRRDGRSFGSTAGRMAVE